MKFYRLFFGITFVSCSVVRDHPKTVPLTSSGNYSILVRARNKTNVAETVRTVCSMIKGFEKSELREERNRHSWLKVTLRNTSAGDCNDLLQTLYNLKGVKVEEVVRKR